MSTPGPTDARTAELAANLADVRARIDAACRSAGRSPDELTLVVVTKTWPAEDVVRLAGLGVHDVGENRDQEAAPKAAACTGLGLAWHFVGRLQSNKARSVASYAAMVHSVDRPELARALDAGAERADRVVDVLVQVSLDADTARGGALVGDVAAVAASVAAAGRLRLRGVMAVAPLGADPAGAFATLMEVSGALRRDHPAADVVSAGMSGDLEAAVAAGATHLRVGTAVLGPRPPLR